MKVPILGWGGGKVIIEPVLKGVFLLLAVEESTVVVVDLGIDVVTEENFVTFWSARGVKTLLTGLPPEDLFQSVVEVILPYN